MKPRSSAFLAILPACAILPLAALTTVWASSRIAIELPDLDTIRRWINRIIELVLLGGIGLSLLVSLAFIGVWVLSHLRRAKAEEAEAVSWPSHIALWSSFIPVALTVVAAAGMFVPVLKPLMLKIFAYAVVGAGAAWLLCVVALIVGGGKAELARARRGLLLAGTPFYCLAIWLGRLL